MTNDNGDVVGEPITEAEDAIAVEEAELAVEHDVEALLTERDSFREMAQRLQAEFENYRKRVAAQTTDDINRATGRIAESLLPVLDACEAAFVAHPAEIEPLFNLLLTELKKQGLEALDLSGQTFDPAKADAVIHEEGEGDGSGNPVVCDVIRTG
jgi:molecular chaperone GrpE